MSREDFIRWVYCVVCTHSEAVTKSHPMRRSGGFLPNLTGAEVITIEIGGESLQQQSDKAIFHYFQSHYLHFFPPLTNRTQFIKQAANLWQIKELIQSRRVDDCGQRTAD